MTKQNLFREYLERKGDSRDYENWFYDEAHKEEKERLTPIDLAQILSKNWEEMNGEGRPHSTSALNKQDPIETMIDFRLKDYKGSFLSLIKDSVKRNKLRLQKANEESDPVYQALESFRNLSLREIANTYNLAKRDISRDILFATYSAHYRLITREMKQDEYEFLTNATYEQFKNKLIGGIK